MSPKRAKRAMKCRCMPKTRVERLSCVECGKRMTIDEYGVANHVTRDGDIDYDLDDDHVAVAEYASF